MSTKPKPSVVYSDDIDVEGGLFLSGELPVTSDLATLRDLVLRWRGVEAELRPHHHKRLIAYFVELRACLTAASSALEKLDNAIDEMQDERRERGGDA